MLATRLTPKWTDYIPHQPHPKQHAFLLLDEILEVFYGGAAGPGKSDGLLMAALQYVDVPGYSALLLRENYGQLALPGALMDRSKTWLDPTDATWHQGLKRWTFPSGATLTFGHVSKRDDVRRYDSAEFHFIGIDEVTHFDESTYSYLFSRLRRGADSTIPIRMRTAGMPGGKGHGWVRRRFVEAETREPGAVFVPAKAADNPHLDYPSYVEALKRTHPVTYRRLLDGDWVITDAGAIYRPREWIRWRQHNPEGRRYRVRYWDLAHSEQTGDNDPDWTVGTRYSLDPHTGLYCVENVVRLRGTGGTVEDAVRGTADRDGTGVHVWIEQEPGAGKSLVGRYKRHVLRGYTTRGHRPQGDKVTRAGPSAAAMEDHAVEAVIGGWNEDWCDELELFPTKGVHDDQVDSYSGAHDRLSRRHVPRGAGGSSTAAGETI